QALEAQFLPTIGMVTEKRNNLGEPADSNATGIGQFVMPARTMTGRGDPMLDELAKWEVNVPDSAKTNTGIPLTKDEERTVQQGAGPYIRRNVAAVMATKEY